MKNSGTSLSRYVEKKNNKTVNKKEQQARAGARGVLELLGTIDNVLSDI
jgi:hypothetical protein